MKFIASSSTFSEEATEDITAAVDKVLALYPGAPRTQVLFAMLHFAAISEDDFFDTYLKGFGEARGWAA